ncbi:MAG: phosphate signaling complex PhoU family protein, partial [Actinomycetota bacterium]
MIRVGFHEALESAESALLAEGALVRQQLVDVMVALRQRDIEGAERVIINDDRVDGAYLDTQAQVLNLLALQAPVAGDLRLVSAILHANVHIERMGDLCVNIAKFVRNRHPYPTDSPMLMRISEMGERAAEMLDLALSAFAQRSVDLSEQLPARDEFLDRLNKGMIGDLKEYAQDEA